MTAAQWGLKIVQGMLMGVGSILPGVSGGVLCVLFEIYQPMMALLANPFKAFPRYYKMFIPVIIGFVLGFVGLAKGVAWMFGENSTLAVSLFVGLIIGMLPSLFREAGEKGRPRSAWYTLAVSFCVLFAVLWYLQSGMQMHITPNAGWYFFCGAVWGLSLVAPGLSSSSILLFMGLYEPMTQGIGALDFGVLIPLGCGILMTALLTGRLVNRLFEKYYAQAYHAILGVVLASTLLIVPVRFASWGEGVLCLLFAAVGAIFAWGMDRWGQQIKEKEAAKND